MATKTTKRASLKVVKTAAEASKPEEHEDSRKAASRARSNAALVEGRRRSAETRAAKAAKAAERRTRGERSNLELYKAGEYPVTAWDDAEIKRGRPRNLDGSFGGAWPNFTGAQQASIRRELLRRGQSDFDSMYRDAIRVLRDVAINGENESARTKAALALIERVGGKVPERLEVHSADPWQDILEDVLSDEVLERVTGEARQDA